MTSNQSKIRAQNLKVSKESCFYSRIKTCPSFRSALKSTFQTVASDQPLQPQMGPGQGHSPPLIGFTNKTSSELPLQVNSLQFPSDYGLPLYHTVSSSLPRNTSNYSSLQPQFFPKMGGNMMPDEQYPTLPFRSPYIHTADSGPSAIVYYPQERTKTSTFQPIYESLSNRDIYSQVCKKQPQKSPAEVTEAINEAEEVKKCDTDSAALDRLSQLLTSKEQSEVSVKTDLILLDKNAPIASHDELSELSSNPNDDAKVNHNKVFQELDDAFTELDQEMLEQNNLEEQQKLRIVSAPTAI